MSAFEKAKISQIRAAREVDWVSAYEELLPKVYHYFCLRLGDRLEAEDLTAATFERAWRDRARYRNDLGTFTNWLFGIARYVAIAHFRQDKPETRIPERMAEAVDRPTEEAAARQEEFERLAAMLISLPAREREIFSKPKSVLPQTKYQPRQPQGGEQHQPYSHFECQALETDKDAEHCQSATQRRDNGYALQVAAFHAAGIVHGRGISQSPRKIR